MLDEIQQDTFEKDETRIWKDGETDVLLPHADNDVIFVFTHILQHFFKGGIGVRQICDWCRLLWTYRNEIDHFKFLLFTACNIHLIDYISSLKIPSLSISHTCSQARGIH